MNVTRSKRAATPGYPNRRQYRLLIGAAAVGLGTAISQGEGPLRLGGDLKVEPRESPQSVTKPAVTMGVVRADPGTSCTATNLPAVPPVATSTNKPVVDIRLRGEMPAETK